MAGGSYTESTYKNVGMEGTKADEVGKFLEYMKNQIKYVSSSSPFSYTIDRVLKTVSDVKPDAYTPRLVSIGPLHRQDIHLKRMETHKLRLVENFLNQTSKKATLADYFKEMKDLEKEVRQCYSEVIPLNEDEFVRMMLVDALFLLELILRWGHLSADTIFNDTLMPHIIRDLMLLENQLPFLVLEKLYKLSDSSSESGDGIYRNTLSFLQKFLPILPLHGSDVIIKPADGTKHLLDCARHLLVLSPAESAKSIEELRIMHLNKLARYLSVTQPLDEQRQQQLFQSKHCATKLKTVAAVKFQKSNTRYFTDMAFVNGILRIPPINIDHSTESLLRNLIALEQSGNYYEKYVTAYAVFMSDLIKSPEDVKLLRKDDQEIFGGQIVNPAEVAALFNNLLKEVTLPADDELCFNGVYRDLGTYYDSERCRRETKWHRFVSKVFEWMNILITVICDRPWSAIGFLGATALLASTIAQTIAAY